MQKKILIKQHEVPDWILPLYLENYTYNIIYGGRGAAKSFCVAEFLVAASFTVSNVVFLCCRETQDSLKDSVHFLLSKRIRKMELTQYFKITREGIKNLSTNVNFVFTGLWQNVESVKSIPDIKYVWIEEAATISKESWDLLIPTVTRNEGCKIICTFNPSEESDVIYRTFVTQEPPPNSYVRKVSYRDNPYPMGKEFFIELEHKKKTDYEAYLHDYEGECKKHSNIRVFVKDKHWFVEEFEQPRNAHLHFGLDFGFSPEHPTAGIRCYIDDKANYLYITHEAVKTELSLEHMGQFLEERLPQLKQYCIYADNAGQIQIDYLKRRGYWIEPVKKGAGSIEGGIEYIKSFSKVIIHPRCVETIKEFSLYSYKVDERSGDIKQEIIDKNNHCIDSIRYSLENCMRNTSADYTKWDMSVFDDLFIR
ncbi:Phage terminase large subunit (plasmid) [Candidatus Trichorickettsia mobilis]|uniref:Phage terminase large subunit n=1 Tax=Candidatus Trichorickettsia mobilis TaxID=1346319 RepID=A0ABZ0UWM6_9RICK|nr:PBSX family phage terminase large subunit [Candidatus Trichorickettsia mobilis]WPY01512.1 Phage terminase large subunit [Candidatus Trichorickettsia mobilis]